MTVKIGIYIAIAVAVAGLAGGVYYKIYNDGKEAVRREQEKKLNVLKDTTHDAQTGALTDPKPRDSLRKYSRPDD